VKHLFEHPVDACDYVSADVETDDDVFVMMKYGEVEVCCDCQCAVTFFNLDSLTRLASDAVEAGSLTETTRMIHMIASVIRSR
jgi:hypothetical protein